MNTNVIVAKIITERKYINCPKWLLDLVDYSSFIRMTDNMGEFIISYYTDNDNNYKPFSAEYKGLIDVIQSYSHRSDVFTARKVIRYLIAHNPLFCGIPYIAAYYLTSKGHWKYFVKMVWVSWSKYMRNGAITRILTTIASMSQIPQIAFDAILCHSNCNIANMLYGNILSINDHQKGLLLTYDDVLPKTEKYGEDYVSCYIKIVISAIMRKYCGTSEYNIMLRDKVINVIWDKGISYFPDNGTDEEAIMMINIFSDNNSDKSLPSALIKHIQSYVTRVKSNGDTELLNDLIERLLKLAANNVNNTKFLHTVANLGLAICNKVNAFIMNDAIHMIIDHYNGKPLYDFKSLCGNGNKYSYSSYILSNTKLQHEFIIQGGLPSSLLISHVHAKSRYMYDPENLSVVFKYSSYDETRKLLLDDTIRNMVIEYVIGRQPMYPVIRKIIEVGIDLVKQGNIELSKLLAAIETNYPIRSETDLDKYRLMIADNFPFILLHRFKKQYEDIVPYLPIYSQDYSDFVTMVTKQNCYVSVNFGVVNYTECHPVGLENYMLYDQIKSLVNVSWGYVGDVNLPYFGEKLIDFIKTMDM